MNKSESKVAPLGEPKLVPIGSVHPSPSNPRRIPPSAVEMVARSLREFGWQQPLIVDESGEIIVGHTRHKAARKLRLQKVPVVVFAGTAEQARAYRIADNRTGDYTTWDLPQLAIEIDQLSDGYAEVLGLADWDGIMADFDNAVRVGGLGEEEVEAAGGKRGFHLVVTFPDEETAVRATEMMFDLGAIDVRHKRGQ
jgi:hypothetical protein